MRAKLFFIFILCAGFSNIIYADTSINVSPNQTELTLPLNEKFTYMFYTRFTTDLKTYYSFSLSKTVSPDDNGLLVEFPKNWSEWRYNTSTAPVTHVFITPQKVGQYALSITATIHETGQASSFTIPINVNTGKNDPEIAAPVLIPDSLPINAEGRFTLRINVAGTDLKADATLEQVTQNGELIKEMGHLKNGPYEYSNSFVIPPSPEGWLFFRAKLVFPESVEPRDNNDHLRYSRIESLWITRFNKYAHTIPANKHTIIMDSKAGNKIMANEVLIGFQKYTSPDRIEEIISSINGEILSVSAALNNFHIEIPGPDNSKTIHNAIDKLKKFLEVEFAEPNGVMSLD